MEIILAINRCIVLCCSRPVRMMLFKGRRTWFWIIPPICYGLYVFVFEKPILFSGIYFSWLFNAHVGYQPINKEALDVCRAFNSVLIQNFIFSEYAT